MPTLTELNTYVHQHIFKNVFNYACNTLRNNVKLVTMNNGRPIRGAIYNNVIQTEFPDTANFYYLFMCGSASISNLIRSIDEWTTIDEVINSEGIRFDVYMEDHLLISKAVTYVRMLSEHQIGVIVPEKVFRRMGVRTNPQMYLTVSKDTDQPGDRISLNHAPLVADRWSDIVSALGDAGNAGKMLLYVNGQNIEPSRFISTTDPLEDFVELVVDGNVMFDFSVSLEDRQTYMSEEEQLIKDVIMIPRNLSGDHVFTYDTFDIVVRDTDTGKGMFLPYFAEESVSQLTHNSIAISSYLIDSVFDLLEGDHYELYIQVSNYSKNNTLLSNGSLTDYLYREDDTWVKTAMRDGLYPKVDVWTGSRLESSEYSKMMTHLTNPDDTLEEKISAQVDCLGFHNYINTICKHTGVIDVQTTVVSELVILKPFYWEGTDVLPMIYVNGLKLRHDLYSVVNELEYLKVVFTVPYTLPTNAVVRYALMLWPDPISYEFAPSSSNRNLLIPDEGIAFRVFRRVDSSYHDHLGLLGSTAYEELNPLGSAYFSSSSSGDSVRLFFNTISYGEDFIVCMEEGGFINQYYSRNVVNGEPLHFFLETESVAENIVPVLTPGNHEVYLNGHYLVLGVDYGVHTITDNDGFLKGYDVVIQNKHWLLPLNDVEVIRTNQEWKSSEVGYVVDRRIPCTDRNEVWVDGLSKMFLNGRLVNPAEVIRHKAHYEVASGVSTNGNLYHIVVPVSLDIARVVRPFEDNQYTTDRHSVAAYYAHLYEYDNLQPIIVPSTHCIYSVYLTETIKKILSGELIVEYVADDQAILDQLGSVEYLKQYDLFFQSNNLNMDYCDVYPLILDNVETASMDDYLFIRRLVTIVLGADAVNDGEVVFYPS